MSRQSAAASPTPWSSILQAATSLAFRVPIFRRAGQSRLRAKARGALDSYHARGLPFLRTGLQRSTEVHIVTHAQLRCLETGSQGCEVEEEVASSFTAPDEAKVRLERGDLQHAGTVRCGLVRSIRPLSSCHSCPACRAESSLTAAVWQSSFRLSLQDWRLPWMPAAAGRTYYSACIKAPEPEKEFPCLMQDAVTHNVRAHNQPTIELTCPSSRRLADLQSTCSSVAQVAPERQVILRSKLTSSPSSAPTAWPCSASKSTSAFQQQEEGDQVTAKPKAGRLWLRHI